MRARAAGRSTPLPVHVLIETHGAVDASALRSPGQFDHRLISRAKAEVVAAALSQGVVPAHNVCLNLKDAEVIAVDATRARREFGFQRMWSIHPAQTAPIVAAMRPALAEVDGACAIIQAAQEVDWGPIQYKGELNDRATYRYFWSLVKRASATGVLLSEEVGQRFFADV